MKLRSFGFSACASIGAALTLLGSFAKASTFVGNGGSSGEIEIRVARQQIGEIFKSIESIEPSAASSLCECKEEFNHRPICTLLSTLTDEQKLFCGKLMIANARKLQELSTGDQVHMSFVNKDIEVLEAGRLRAVEGVANRDKNEILLNHDRFLELAPHERLFLLTHELLHFVKVDDRPLEDEGEIGPFKGGQGAKSLIDAVSAAAVMTSVEENLDKRYVKTLRRAQGWKTNWLDLSVGTSEQVANSTDELTSTSLPLIAAGLRHYFGGFGVDVRLQGESSKKDVVGQSTGSEKRILFGVGVSYRLFPNSNPLSYWGQTQFVFDAEADWIHGDYEWQDDYVGTSAKSGVLGGSFGASYEIPMFRWLWAFLSVRYEYQPIKYEFSDISGELSTLTYSANRISVLLGVSHAF